MVGHGTTPGLSGISGGRLDLKRQPLVCYGADIRSAVPQLARERSWGPVLPVVTSSLSTYPRVNETLAALGAAVLPAFTRLKPHTPFEVVLELCERIREDNADAILVIGGGSAVDAAKIAALAASVGVRDYEDLLALRATSDASGIQRSSPGSRTSLAIMAVPTTLSGAEFGLIGGATDSRAGIKHLYRADALAPDIVVYDPVLALATPLGLWLSTGVRAVDHAVETVISQDANPFTDALALRALALLREGLPAAKQDAGDIVARHQGQLGSWLAASGIGRVRYGASHGLGHQLGAVAGVPHGITSCVLLPAVLAFNEAVSTPGQAAIAAAFGRPDLSAAGAVRAFIRSLDLPDRISELGLARDALPRIAESSLSNAFVRANVRQVTGAADLEVILETAW
jgi:alcohol dehydrogenase class IV